jgi:hypothetical protein
MSRLEIPSPCPPKRKRPPKRSKKHPEARLEEISRKDAERRSSELGTGWRFPYGWRVRLYRSDNGFRVVANADTYLEAVALRDEHMRSGVYEKAWVELRTE